MEIRKIIIWLPTTVKISDTTASKLLTALGTNKKKIEIHELSRCYSNILQDSDIQRRERLKQKLINSTYTIHD